MLKKSEIIYIQPVEKGKVKVTALFRQLLLNSYKGSSFYFLQGILILILNLNLTFTSGDSMSKKHLSFIEQYAQEFTIPEIQKPQPLNPNNPEFYKPESDKTLFRSWQKNAEIGSTVYTIDRYFNVEKILCEPKWRVFFQSYRCFNTFLSFDDACAVRDKLLKFLEQEQYRLYGKTLQTELEFS